MSRVAGKPVGPARCVPSHTRSVLKRPQDCCKPVFWGGFVLAEEFDAVCGREHIPSTVPKQIPPKRDPTGMMGKSGTPGAGVQE